MKIQAFTLIELLIAISIAGILLIAAVPTFHSFILKNQAAAEVNNIVAALQFSRSEAIKRNMDIKFCKKGNWQNGQIVKTEQGKVIRIFPSLPAGDKLIWKSSLGQNNCVEFSPIGSTNGQKGSFYYFPHNDKKNAKIIIINANGRIKYE